MYRTRIVLGLAVLWGADLAGAFLLDDGLKVVANGAAVALSVALVGRWVERRANARAQKFIFEADKERAALIKTIAQLTGVTQTGPTAALRDVA